MTILASCLLGLVGCRPPTRVLPSATGSLTGALAAAARRANAQRPTPSKTEDRSPGSRAPLVRLGQEQLLLLVLVLVGVEHVGDVGELHREQDRQVRVVVRHLRRRTGARSVARQSTGFASD